MRRSRNAFRSVILMITMRGRQIRWPSGSPRDQRPHQGPHSWVCQETINHYGQISLPDRALRLRENNAQAFAHGRDIYFGARLSLADSELTAHELAQVIQRGATVRRRPLPEVEDHAAEAASEPSTEVRNGIGGLSGNRLNKYRK